MDMCYATKTSEVCAKIQVLVDLDKSLQETIEYILSKFSRCLQKNLPTLLLLLKSMRRFMNE